MTDKTIYYIKNITIYGLLTLLITTFITMQFFDVEYFDNYIANTMFENTLLRFIGGIIFMMLMFKLGLNKIFQFSEPVRAILIVFPAFIISINN